jgi:nucleoside-diphosphate-sugar epimerase
VIAVTGGSGVVGRAVVAALLARGDKVRVLDPKPPPEPRAGVEHVAVSVLDRRGVARALEGCRGVVHLAAALPQARLDEAGFRELNVGGTRVVAAASRAVGVRRLVFASTIEIYGPQHSATPLGEDAPRRFTGVYSHTKWESERVLFDGYGDLEPVALRLPMVMGPGFYHEPSVLRTFHALRLGRPIPVSAPDALVSFVAASDAAQAFVLALEVPEAVGEAFNIAAPDTPTMRAFFAELVALTGSSSRLVPLPSPLVRAGVAAAGLARLLGRRELAGTPVELVGFAATGGAYAIDKARRLLGYAPATRCAEAWAATYRAYFEARAGELTREGPAAPSTSRSG